VPGRPTGAIALNFGLRGDVADVITHAKFYINRLRGFGVLLLPILPFCTGLAGRPYNSVSTIALNCDAEVTSILLDRYSGFHEYKNSRISTEI